MNTLQELTQIARTRPEKLKEQKEKGVKIVGYIGRFVPEELIHASGALPYLLYKGGQPEPPDAVIPYMLRFMSPYARSQIGYRLLGIDPVVPMLDLIDNIYVGSPGNWPFQVNYKAASSPAKMRSASRI